MNEFRPASAPSSGAPADRTDPSAAPAPLRPARLDFLPDGRPHSRDYGDVYTSDAGAAGQARHVFLGGNGLPGRWQGRARFTVVETGFGFGNNFLETLAAWRADPARCARLWFVSFEAHPVTAQELRRGHGLTDATAAPSAATPHDAAELARQWPLPLPGLHRLEFADGAVQLLLAFGDAGQLAPRLTLGADAFYLDGFAPDRNPRMWSARLFGALARLAAPDATAATWTYARAVRDALAQAGFEVGRARGHGDKRDMLVATLAPHRRARALALAGTGSGETGAGNADRGAAIDPAARQPATNRRHEPARRPPATALVIGAGLAGCAVAARLLARGLTVTLIDAGPAPASLTSGNPAGALQPLVARDDARQARFARAGYLAALRSLQGLASLGLDVGGERAGLLHLATDAAEEAAMRAALAALDFPPGHVRWVERAEAAELARGPVRGGMPLPPGAGAMAGGYLFPDGGWLVPARYCGALLAAADPRGERLRPCFGTPVAALQAAAAGGWTALAASGQTLAGADIAVIATGAEALPALPAGAALDWPIQRIAGQLNLLPMWAPAPAIPVTGDGYVLPALAAGVLVGATYELDPARVAAVAANGQLTSAAEAENRARYARLLDLPEAALRAAALLPAPDADADTDAPALPGRSGLRAVASDRLPLVGAVGQALDAAAPDHHLADWPRLPGLYAATAFASRGITWAALAGEIVAALACGDPAPVDTELLDAVDPARFAQRRHRRGR
ncbi:FAD-dependent 5-carboxymethylaminomethyl-2-thiouridine(34) oxidoreductase MnmC [Derxia lacustris]|uniref:FAD-dependent 5-carboxymethylaminomethyl-2-thiouridine(34) oxidoreductase MnmC n=1 Tax=Derxia lacustris TaxID=764842 RepID=UPI000A16F31A|nr:FAD-dependent 5-carboxymethylaminomethyl-2-thiouridine(34) oxidoreductase MnmC [Derxia lacustris]